MWNSDWASQPHARYARSLNLTISGYSFPTPSGSMAPARRQGQGDMFFSSGESELIEAVKQLAETSRISSMTFELCNFRLGISLSTEKFVKNLLTLLKGFTYLEHIDILQYPNNRLNSRVEPNSCTRSILESSFAFVNFISISNLSFYLHEIENPSIFSNLEYLNLDSITLKSFLNFFRSDQTFSALKRLEIFDLNSFGNSFSLESFFKFLTSNCSNISQLRLFSVVLWVSRSTIINLQLTKLVSLDLYSLRINDIDLSSRPPEVYPQFCDTILQPNLQRITFRPFTYLEGSIFLSKLVEKVDSSQLKDLILIRALDAGLKGEEIKKDLKEKGVILQEEDESRSLEEILQTLSRDEVNPWDILAF
jgi:hypothetical protein